MVVSPHRAPLERFPDDFVAEWCPHRQSQPWHAVASGVAIRRRVLNFIEQRNLLARKCHDLSPTCHLSTSLNNTTIDVYTHYCQEEFCEFRCLLREKKERKNESNLISPHCRVNTPLSVSPLTHYF